MKQKLFTFLGIMLAISTMTYGQFEKAMGENIPAVFATQAPQSTQEVVNKLIRIGEAESDRWEPYYYAGFGYLRMSGMFEEAEEKDRYLNLALDQVKKGQEIDENNSELEALRGYCIMMQLTIDPQERGMMYSGMAFEAFQNAIEMDPKNPRAHYLMGRMQHGTAQFMGGGNEQACGSLFQAMVLYQKGEKPKNPFAPTWGQESTEASIKEICEGTK